MAGLRTPEQVQAQYNLTAASYDRAVEALSASASDDEASVNIMRQRADTLYELMLRLSREYDRLTSGGGIKLYAGIPTDV